jgi:hypothetical protein
MPSEGIGEFARAQLRPGQRVIDGQIKRDIGQHDDPAPVECRAHAVDSLRDLGFSDLLKQGLASRVGMHLHLHDIGATVAHASATGLEDVLTDRDERFGVGCAKGGVSASIACADGCSRPMTTAVSQCS